MAKKSNYNGKNRIKGILEDVLGTQGQPSPLFGMAHEIATQVHTEHMELQEKVVELALEVTGPMEPEEFKEKYVLAKQMVHKDLFGEGVITLSALAVKDTGNVLKVWKTQVKLSMTPESNGMQFTTSCELGELDEESVRNFNDDMESLKGAE